VRKRPARTWSTPGATTVDIAVLVCDQLSGRNPAGGRDGGRYSIAYGRCAARAARRAIRATAAPRAVDFRHQYLAGRERDAIAGAVRHAGRATGSVPRLTGVG
jgi:hypothetical protein